MVLHEHYVWSLVITPSSVFTFLPVIILVSLSVFCFFVLLRKKQAKRASASDVHAKNGGSV